MARSHTVAGSVPGWFGRRPGFRRRLAVAAAGCALAAVVAVPGEAAAQPGGTPGPDTEATHHCIHPSGLDLNEFYGLSEWLVHPACTQVDAGEPWTVVSIWFVGGSFEAVPEEFVPAGETPVEDFRAKFVGARHVVDPGTSQEQTLFFPADDRLFAAASPILEGQTVVSPIRSTIAEPLSVGDHAVQVSWVMSDLHCDGLAADLANCLPAGETVLGTLAFEVTIAGTTLRAQRPSYSLLGARLTAVLTNSRSGGPIAGQSVSFRTGGGSSLCAGVTADDGVATCRTGLLGRLAILLGGGYQAEFAGTDDHLASTGRAPASPAARPAPS